MIKSIVSGFVALSVLATPVAAEARHRDHRGERHHSRISTGEAIAIGVGAFILGAAASSGNRRSEPVYDRDYDRGYDRGYSYEYEYRRPACREVISSGYDRYGYYYEKRTVRC